MTSALQETAPVRWHVLGTGAMGCLWAVRLWQHAPLHQRVTLLLRDAAHMAAYRQCAGITLEEGSEILTALPLPAETVTETGPVLTHLLVATKAQDVAAALASVRQRLTGTTRIVLLQNGVRVQREISAQFGAARVFCLSTSHGAWRRAPFHVIHAGRGTAWLGSLGHASAADLEALLALLPSQSMQIRTDRDIAMRLWQKFAVNCAVNALSVLYDCRNGELLRQPAARRELEELVTEIAAVLASVPDVPRLPDLPDSVAEVLRVSANNVSSTLQDVRHGRATELAHLNGYLCDLARQHGVESPLNDALLQRVAALPNAPAA